MWWNQPPCLQIAASLHSRLPPTNGITHLGELEPEVCQQLLVWSGSIARWEAGLIQARPINCWHIYSSPITCAPIWTQDAIIMISHLPAYTTMIAQSSPTQPLTYDWVYQELFTPTTDIDLWAKQIGRLNKRINMFFQVKVYSRPTVGRDYGKLISDKQTPGKTKHSWQYLKKIVLRFHRNL